MWSSIQVLPNQVSKKSFYTFEDIEVRNQSLPKDIGQALVIVNNSV